MAAFTFFSITNLIVFFFITMCMLRRQYCSYFQLCVIQVFSKAQQCRGLLKKELLFCDVDVSLKMWAIYLTDVKIPKDYVSSPDITSSWLLKVALRTLWTKYFLLIFTLVEVIKFSCSCLCHMAIQGFIFRNHQIHVLNVL